MLAKRAQLNKGGASSSSSGSRAGRSWEEMMEQYRARSNSDATRGRGEEAEKVKKSVAGRRMSRSNFIRASSVPDMFGNQPVKQENEEAEAAAPAKQPTKAEKRKALKRSTSVTQFPTWDCSPSPNGSWVVMMKPLEQRKGRKKARQPAESSESEEELSESEEAEAEKEGVIGAEATTQEGPLSVSSPALRRVQANHRRVLQRYEQLRQSFVCKAQQYDRVITNHGSKIHQGAAAAHSIAIAEAMEAAQKDLAEVESPPSSPSSVSSNSFTASSSASSSSSLAPSTASSPFSSPLPSPTSSSSLSSTTSSSSSSSVSSSSLLSSSCSPSSSRRKKSKKISPRSGKTRNRRSTGRKKKGKRKYVGKENVHAAVLVDGHATTTTKSRSSEALPRLHTDALKRPPGLVTSHSDTQLPIPDDVLWNEDGTLEAAPVSQLIDMLADENLAPMEQSKPYIVTFLQTCRYWLRPSELLARLCRRYRLVQLASEDSGEDNNLRSWFGIQTAIRFRVITVLQMWIERDFHMFPLSLVPNLSLFISSTLKNSEHSEWTDLLVHSLKQLVQRRQAKLDVLRGTSIEMLSHIMRTVPVFRPYLMRNLYKVPHAVIASWLRSEWGIHEAEHLSIIFWQMIMVDCSVFLINSNSSSSSPAFPISKADLQHGLSGSLPYRTFKSASPDACLSPRSSINSPGVKCRKFYEETILPNRTQLVFCWFKPRTAERHKYAAPLFVASPALASDLEVLNVPALELARQLTLLEQWMFGSLSVIDCTRVSRNKSEKVKRLIEFSNRTARWVASEVVGTLNEKKRISVLKHFFQVLEHCKSLNNISSFVSITQGLTHPAVSRLKSTWRFVPKKYRSMLEEAEALTSVLSNFSRLRAYISQLQPPIIPYFALFLRDITLIEISNPDHLGNPHQWINWDKFVLLGQQFSAIHSLQQTPFEYLPNRCVQNYLLSTPLYEENELFRLSAWAESQNI